MRGAAFFLVLGLLWVDSAVARDPITVSIGKDTEEYERDVDQVAASSQEQAISKLSVLLKKYRNTPQEPALLFKLAELQQQYAAILFRIGHGYSKRTGGSDLSRYQKATQSCISTLNQLIGRYPGFEAIPHAFFLRAKSHEEVANKKAAVSDYEYLIKHFKDSEDTPAAYMALAEVAIGDNDHPKAIRYLSEVEKLPQDPHFPFALYKLGWSFYNLKEIARAISFLERHIDYYRQLKVDLSAPAAAGVVSDVALVENSFLDLVLFFFDGYEQGDSKYALNNAMAYFKRIEPGAIFGRMLVKFSKLLRSHGHDVDLGAWKDQVLLAEGGRPEALEVCLVAYEYFLNKRRFSQLVEIARDLIGLYSKHGKAEPFAASFVSAQKLLLDTAEGLQGIILKNRGNEEVKPLSQTLAAIYDSFTRIVDDSDPRVPRVHYNLAETLFAIKDYEGATEHYRWVALYEERKGTTKGPHLDAALKAVASRYEVLKLRQLAGQEVTPKSLPAADPLSVDPLLSQWVEWLEQLKPKKASQDADTVESFLFEANRALYFSGRIHDATQRMRVFAEKQPESRFAIPSATLVVDTSIASGNWKNTWELANDFLDIRAWKKGEFSVRLSKLAADSWYKLMEEAHGRKDYAGVLKSADEFFKRYPSSSRAPDVLILAGRTALAVGDRSAAHGYLSRLIQGNPASENLGEALLARAALAEESYEFSKASADYLRFLGLQGESVKKAQTDGLRRKTLLLTWLSGDVPELRSVLGSSAVCGAPLEQDCEKYSALATLGSMDRLGSEEETEAALRKSRKGQGEVKILWAVVGLEGAKHLTYRDRLYLVRQVGSGWEDIDAMARFAVLPRISSTIVRALEVTRQEMGKISPLRSNEKHIRHRVDVLREIENAAAKALTLPWARIRVEVLNQMAWLYLDFARELAKLPPPKGLPPEEVTVYEETVRKLVLPFEEKGQDLRTKAFDLASRMMVDDSATVAVSEPFFSDNPSQAKAQAGRRKQWGGAESRADALDLQWFKKILQSAKQPGLSPQLIGLWSDALSAQKWQKVAFLLAEAKTKSALPDGILGLMRSVSLCRVGAQAEGLAELDAARKDLTYESGNRVALSLATYALRSFSKETREKAAKMLAEIKSEQLNQEQKGLVADLSARLKSDARGQE